MRPRRLTLKITPMKLHIIYTVSGMFLSKKRYDSWHEIQHEYPDYKASLGPWSIEETEEYLKQEYPGIDPLPSEQVGDFVKSTDTVRDISFLQSTSE